MSDANKIIGLLLGTLWFFVFNVPALALDPGQPASSFLRTHFTPDEGLPGAVVDRIAQTHDGFLWLITNGNNLIRFDGKTFYPFYGQRRGTLAVGPDGDLWIGSTEELIRIPSTNVDRFELIGSISYHPGPGNASNITCLRFSKSGVLWVGTADGLFRWENEQFLAVGLRVATREIEEAPDGHLLVRTDQGFVEFAGTEVVPHPQLAQRLGVKDSEIFQVMKDRQGNTWYSTALGVARQTGDKIEKLGTYAPNGHAAMRAYEDEQGTVWIAKDEGLFRATSAGLELVAAGMRVRFLYSDRDGNLWVGTNGDGLYRYKDRAARMFTKADGLPNDIVQTVFVAHDGTVWTGANCGGISRFDGTHFQTFNEKDGLTNSCVWTITEDADHDLWIGTWGGGAFRYHQGNFVQYSKSQGMPDDVVKDIVPARDGSVWFATAAGLARLKDGQIRNFTTADGLSDSPTYRLYEDRSGVLWAATAGGLDRLVGDRFEPFAAAPKTLGLPMGEDRDGGLFVNYEEESVTLRFGNGRVDTIKDIPVPNDLVQTEQGELWFGGAMLSRIPPGSLVRSRQQDEPLDHEDFTVADGLATTELTGGWPGLALSGDGKLWAATPKGLAVLDLRRLPVTNTKPTIYLKDVTLGRDTQRAGHEVVLPTGTHHLELDFAAVEISSPEKIRFQYRLDGVDSEWLDADATNPHAIYSNIPVGTHLLHIRACNRNGIWDRQGVVFSITQQPYFYQTRWFLAAMIGLGLLLVVLIYRLRVRQISRRISARFDERLAERTRVAREIHDTFLQTVQGSKMVADHALKDTADHARMVRAMGQLSTWLEQATEEGRAALNSLRVSTTEKNDLAEAFRRATEECAEENRVEISFSVTGESREMHPVVRDEIYRIGYEAIRNSCAHAGGDRLDVTLKYGHDLTLSISDNGAGIYPEIQEKCKDSHFWLRGMRERAERIGSTFSLVSSTGSGTAITLVVPGRVAFRSARLSWVARTKSRFNSN
jgi:ligand-binding sensor domain-containing protein/signal transduction histidine kinase